MIALFFCPITFAKPLMSSENPKIRHPSIPDSGDTEHGSTNIAASAGEEEKVSTNTSHEDNFNKDGIIKRRDKNHRTGGGDGQDADRR